MATPSVGCTTAANILCRGELSKVGLRCEATLEASSLSGGNCVRRVLRARVLSQFRAFCPSLIFRCPISLTGSKLPRKLNQ
jgi:hypothetical protein